MVKRLQVHIQILIYFTYIYINLAINSTELSNKRFLKAEEKKKRALGILYQENRKFA